MLTHSQFGNLNRFVTYHHLKMDVIETVIAIRRRWICLMHIFLCQSMRMTDAICVLN